MATKKEVKPKAAVPPKDMLWLGADGVIYDQQDQPVVFKDSGQHDGELMHRIVESVNALAGYTLDQIRRGEFKAGIHGNNSIGMQVVTGTGNMVG